MKIAVIPNLDKRGASDVVEKLGLFLKNEGSYHAILRPLDRNRKILHAVWNKK